MDLTSQNSGLLHKIENLQISRNEQSFLNFIQNNKIEIFAELFYYSDFFFCKNSYGLDGETILLSDSTKTFWDGLTPVLGKIYNFSSSDFSLNQILQFFSSELEERITSVSICRLAEDRIILLCNKNLTEKLLLSYKQINQASWQDLTDIKLNPENKNYMLSIDFSESFDDFLSKKHKDESDSRDVYEIALMSELFNRMSSYFASPSAVSKSSKTAVNVIFSLKSVFVPELLHNHLVKLLKSVLESSAELIGLNFLGQAQSAIAAKEFLKVI
ncbi:hypothetical protein [Treponema sp. C6A8]|uniref:hypothetical protein n=1 Tax=Treponema sp. C6A8 TaxID=1410609 RepID=UPI00047FB02F|nr:hypothetical protein [Treponema sp. C6A8]